MRRLRRVTALFVNLLLVQLLLAGTGASCVDRASTMSADHGAMSAAQMATGHDDAAASGSCGSDCADGGSSSSHVPCGMPSSAPGGGGT